MATFNKALAMEHLKKGDRVFTTSSSDGALLVIWSNSETKFKWEKAGVKERPICSRLENSTYSVPFKNPHPLLHEKIMILEELFI